MVGEEETGNETYMANLLRGLALVVAEDEVFVAAAHADHVEPLIAVNPRLKVVPVSVGPFRRLLRELPALAARLESNALYVTYAGPIRCRCPLVVAVHDVSYRRHPEWFSLRDRIVLGLGVGITLRRAAAVVTLSEFSKNEIAALYPIPAERIHVTPLASPSQFRPEENDDFEVLARLGVRKPYVLAVGNLQPRKNLGRLIDAFGRLAARTAFVHDLVLVGKAQWQASELGSRIERLKLADRVKAVGYVSGQDLPALYRGADLFAYPTLYEGFGLPVLEAMASGTPVLTSNVSPIAELAGNAARLVDPLSVDELERGILEMCAEPGRRSFWREAGLALSRRFSWEQTARQTLAIIRRAAVAPGE